ncbi:hypothetical protein Nmel_006182, partial [Mimus melanotis]
MSCCETPAPAFKSPGLPLEIRLDFHPDLFPTHFTRILLPANCSKVASFHGAVSKPPNVTDHRQCATDFMKLVNAEDIEFCIDILENIQVLSEDI